MYAFIDAPFNIGTVQHFTGGNAVHSNNTILKNQTILICTSDIYNGNSGFCGVEIRNSKPSLCPLCTLIFSYLMCKAWHEPFRRNPLTAFISLSENLHRYQETAVNGGRGRQL